MKRLNNDSEMTAHADWLIGGGGGGDMGELIRSMDWSATPLGPRADWPYPLQVITNMALSSAFAMAILWGKELIFIYNDAYKVIAADKHPYAMGRSTREIWAEVWDFNKPIFEKVMQEGQTVHLEDQLFRIKRRAKMEDAFFTLSYSPIWLDHGHVGGTLVTLIETTERLRAEAALTEAKELFSKAFRASPNAMAISRMADGAIMEINDVWEADFGYSRAESVGTSSTSLGVWVDPAKRQEAIRRLQETGSLRDFEIELRCKTDEVRKAVLSGESLEIGGEQCLITAIYDITKRKHSEEALLQSEEKYRNLFEGGADAILFLEKGVGNITEANRTAVNLFGYCQDELCTMKLTNLSAEPDKTREAMEKGETMVPLRLYRKKDGTILPVEIAGRDFIFKDKEVRIVWIRDITRRKKIENEKEKLEAQLRHAQKMEAISTLAGGIAHDFNNILTIILGYSQLAQTRLTPESESYEDLKEVIQSANRAKSLIQQILAIGRSQEQEKQPLQLTPIVKESLKFLRSTLPSTIEIQKKIGKDVGLINADPTQMHQVLMNLCTNASHAMEKEGGTLTVCLRNVPIYSQELESEVHIKPGRYLALSVGDTGYGIAPEIREKIFDPYFTTKEPGMGTGIGLFVVHGIVEQHGGAIRVENEPGKGCVFHIYLPLSRKQEEEPVFKGEASLPRGDERILFIDDEATIANMGKEMLRGLGYDVTAITSSPEGFGFI